MREADLAFMARALELAERGRGFTSPNPVVGAVVVRDGRIVGEGLHERYGGPHAEVNALAEAGEKARGASLYVTLEPCCVWGNTPPCTDAVVAAGIRRVAVAAEDLNPEVSGRGIALLRERGLTVLTGVLRDAAEAANEPYTKFRRTGLPLVRVKMALSLDGRAAGPEGAPRWISCPESRERAHAMRAAADCVMVGIGTVLADDPELTDRRSARAPRQPARLVLDRDLRLPHRSRLVAGARSVRTAVACGEDACARRAREIGNLGVEVWPVPSDGPALRLDAVLRRAAEHGMIDVLCEGGPRVATSLLREGLADRLALFVAPSLIGREGTDAFGSLGPSWWKGDGGLRDVRWERIGDDLLLEARVALG